MTNRPLSTISDFTSRSRAIEKIADMVLDEVAALTSKAIDPDYPSHLEDEELDDYIQARDHKLVIMVCQSLLGSDKVVA